MKLVLQNVEKSFGEKKVLANLSFQFEKGKIYGLLGRNGAGKNNVIQLFRWRDPSGWRQNETRQRIKNA
ncbi:ATP-binding cassette domain-containing protein [Paenibacillus sp. W4I10]|uniref:ATP-binding cassette domain-containing protein n=1 Tax=Paenibacillus sp. W4I10 TaxID=3042298 RepID=UPI00358FA07F